MTSHENIDAGAVARRLATVGALLAWQAVSAFVAGLVVLRSLPVPPHVIEYGEGALLASPIAAVVAYLAQIAVIGLWKKRLPQSTSSLVIGPACGVCLAVIDWLQ